MSKRPLISATLIARNEQGNVKRLLDSIWKCVDEVVVVDTGSADDTVGELRRYAQRKKQPHKLKIGHFEWCDDFAAARQAADDLATGEWLLWADFDDEVQGLEYLKPLVESAGDDIRAFFCAYSYARDQDGNTISELWRERIVRNDGTRWKDPLHEHKLLNDGGQIVKIGDPRVRWVHHRDHEVRTSERNLRILRAWQQQEPDSARISHSIAMELLGDQEFQAAADEFSRYLTLPGEAPDRRGQASRLLVKCLLALNKPQDARQVALNALAENWMWADTHLSLAEIEHTIGDPAVGVRHAQEALSLGLPDTLIIVNPVEYTVHARFVMAACLAQLGQFDKAVQVAEEASEIAPGYPLLNQMMPIWAGALKRQQVSDTILALADVYVETGELAKAKRLLADVPFFVVDEERIVQRRARVHAATVRRLAGEDGGVGEDEAARAFLERHLQEAA